MIFAHTQDQLDLRDGAREYLRGTCTAERLRELRENDQADIGIWSELAELGLLGFLAPEAQGGLGSDAIGFALIAEEAGYVGLPEPLVDSAGVAMAVASHLEHSQTIAAIAAGGAKVLSSHSCNPYINQLSEQDSFIHIAKQQVRYIKAADCEITLSESIDPMRRLSAINCDADMGELLAEGVAAQQVHQLALNHGALFTAAELLGLAARMIAMATDYAKDRQQFGKPIGSYQAVKHHLASALVKLEFARPCVYRASADLASGAPKTELSIAHAKIAANDAATNAAEVAIQIHGGMGYTFEVDLHMWMKRAWALGGIWGDRNYHMNVVDKEVIGESLSIGPAETFY